MMNSSLTESSINKPSKNSVGRRIAKAFSARRPKEDDKKIQLRKPRNHRDTMEMVSMYALENPVSPGVSPSQRKPTMKAEPSFRHARDSMEMVSKFAMEQADTKKAPSPKLAMTKSERLQPKKVDLRKTKRHRGSMAAPTSPAAKKTDNSEMPKTPKKAAISECD